MRLARHPRNLLPDTLRRAGRALVDYLDRLSPATCSVLAVAALFTLLMWVLPSAEVQTNPASHADATLAASQQPAAARRNP